MSGNARAPEPKTVGEMIMEKKHNMCVWLCSLPMIEEQVRNAIKELESLRADLFIAHFRRDVLPILKEARAKSNASQAPRDMAIKAMLEELSSIMFSTFHTYLPSDVMMRLLEYYDCFEDLTNPPARMQPPYYPQRYAPSPVRVVPKVEKPAKKADTPAKKERQKEKENASSTRHSARGKNKKLADDDLMYLVG